MELIVVPPTVGSGSVRRYSEKEWDLHRRLITHLYRARRKTLHEVRTFIWQQYDFRVR
jgi:DNA-binding transcriptional MerR regulator